MNKGRTVALIATAMWASQPPMRSDSNDVSSGKVRTEAEMKRRKKNKAARKSRRRNRK